MKEKNIILYIGEHQETFKKQLYDSAFNEEDFSVHVAEDEATLDKLLENTYSAVIYDAEPKENPSIADICCKLDDLLSPETNGGSTLGIFLNISAEYDRELANCIQAKGGLPTVVYEYERGIKTKDGITQSGFDYSSLISFIKNHFNGFFAQGTKSKYSFSTGPEDKRYVDITELARASIDLGSTEEAISLMIQQLNGNSSSLRSAKVIWPLNNTPKPQKDPLCVIEISIDGQNGRNYSLIIPGKTDNKGNTSISDFRQYERILSTIYRIGCRSCDRTGELTGYKQRLESYGIRI